MLSMFCPRKRVHILGDAAQTRAPTRIPSWRPWVLWSSHAILRYDPSSLYRLLVRELGLVLINMPLHAVGPSQRDRNSSEPLDADQSTTTPLITASSSGPSLSLDPSLASAAESFQDSPSRSNLSGRVGILPWEEAYLYVPKSHDGPYTLVTLLRRLQKYFEVVHDAMPILSKSRFYAGIDSSQISQDLILTLVLITAKLTDFRFIHDDVNADTHIDEMLSFGSLEEMISESPNIDQLRKACLLAFYEFHQFPGRTAWLHIGKITRIAYWMGLDRLEDPVISRSLGSPGDREDWRLVWWCIYRLDSYANLSAGTPYLVDEGLVGTALAQDQQPLTHSPDDSSATVEKLFLPAQPDGLDRLASSTAVLTPQNLIFNLHIITATAMRQCGRALRLFARMPKAERSLALTDIERSLSALRLALPSNYLNPMRNASADETSYQHHARLVTVLHMNMARLLVSILRCATVEEGDEWLLSWQQNLETCQDIASVSEQWNSTFTLSVDPAVSFILFTTLIFLDIHIKAAVISASQFQSKLEHCKGVLLLLLEQFSKAWTLPRLLIRTSSVPQGPRIHQLIRRMHEVSYRSFNELLVGPLSHQQILLILSRFEAPLHPRWLQFLSSASIEHLHA
jgi:hypothetical protein